MSVDLFECVTECGCAAKVPAHVLAGMLAGIDIPGNPAVIVGAHTLDDAGVYELSEEHCLVQTVDFFPPVARDPYDYGRIAAANSLSDVYAMGGRPITALGIVCFPSELLKRGALEAIMRGAGETLAEAGCALLGGHSVLDPQAKFGLSVTGLVQRDKLMSNAQARPGDVLILTKPLGTGVTIMAVRAGMADAGQEQAANRTMAVLNEKASILAARAGVRCATDITGFGLLGHAMQLARASGVRLEFALDAIPLLDGALDFAARGLLSAAAYSNRAYVGDAVVFAADVARAGQDILVDPQTSGGLLLCCPPAQAAAFIARAREELSTPCAIVGRVHAADGRPLIAVNRHLHENTGNRDDLP